MTTTRRSLLAAALLTAFAAPQMSSAAVAAPRPATASPAEVPAPATRAPIGTKTLHLVDTSRPDPWKPAAGNRELMVSLWYPALPSAGPKAPYASKELAKKFLGSEAAATVRTHATLNAPAAPKARPLVVLSPGFGMSRLTLTALGEDLASRGYAVAAVDHTYEAPVEFPGGRMEDCLICGKAGLPVIPNRAEDISFVLDRLTAPGSPLRVDRDRIGVAGHSIGGASAVEAARTDRRVKAAVNMDGNFFSEPTTDLNRPVLLLGAQRAAGEAENRDDWERTWRHLTGWKRWLDVAQGGHLTFTDAPWLVERFGMPPNLPPGSESGAFGTLKADRATALTRTYVSAFFDRHLRGVPNPLLERPSAAYPEVAFLK
ncbi:dienelactone hydrolase family protein [Streptomyces sp. UNOB3_S3]|uniref:alpha/beta hydrolase family protein n=1 Tax=Streptomyces sp. UNOB3_S3 TaxID=2871682 RepID=UPI001E50BC3C|nr:dienelactone hydrolase family protein [Streptomyces sp. UNOB3_S3]MCC3774168.1 dienelactone hydrolase family protein [Streptomyces sp. UNOB3_S3]